MNAVSVMNRKDGFIKKYDHISEKPFSGKWETSAVKLCNSPSYYVLF